MKNTPSSMSLLTLFVFSSWPFVVFITHNLNRGVVISDLFDIYIVYNALILLGYIVASKLIGKNGKLLNCLIVLTVCVYNFSAFVGFFESLGLDKIYIKTLYLLIVFSLIFATWKLSNSNVHFYSPLIFIGIILYLPAVIDIVSFGTKSNQRVRADNINYEFLNSQITNKKPNVYFILVDGFGRSDVLKTQFKYDNSLFISKLKEQGFYIADHSVANFPITNLSMASTLNMNYVVAEGASSLKSHVPFERFIRGDNATTRFFKNQGYQYIHSYSQHWGGTRCESELIDDCYFQGQKDGALISNTETVKNFFKMTPFASLTNRVGHDDSPALKKIAKKVTEVSKSSNAPFFLFAHVLAPHPPYTYGDNCDVVLTDSTSRSPWDAESYITQVKCVEDDLITLVATILSTDKEEPIIIIQGDHGPATRDQFSKQKSDWDFEDMTERYGVLNAIHIHHACRDNLYATMSLVNTFRIITACLLDRSPELLADTSMFATYDGRPDYGLIAPFLKQ